MFGRVQHEKSISTNFHQSPDSWRSLGYLLQCGIEDKPTMPNSILISLIIKPLCRKGNVAE